MNDRARAVAFCAVLLCSVASPAAALAAEGTPPSPTPAGAEAPPAAGAVSLTLAKVGGKPPFALVGGSITVKGVVTPYVAGQSVRVSFYLNGSLAAGRTVAVAPAANGAGKFSVVYSSRVGGLLRARADHYATAQQAAFSASAPAVRFVSAGVGPGDAGQSVRLLQSELNALHYAVPLSGRFEEGTEEALIAYRKMLGLARVPEAGRVVFERLKKGKGSFHVRYRGDGRHVEADLTRQVLAEIEPGGRIHAIYTISSGKPSTPTVLGRFQVYLKTPGENSEGMVDSNYFIRGYAIHGYHEVPTYAASHGCLRVPIPDAPEIYAWVRLGMPVDVYYE